MSNSAGGRKIASWATFGWCWLLKICFWRLATFWTTGDHCSLQIRKGNWVDFWATFRQCLGHDFRNIWQVWQIDWVACGVVAGPDMAEEWASEVQGGGRHAEDSTASQHRAFLWLLRGAATTWQASHRACYRAHDIRNPQNVRCLVSYFIDSAPSLGVYYCQQLTLPVCPDVCPDVCLSRSFKLLLLFCFSMESSHFLAVSSPCGTLQNVFLDFWFRPLTPKIYSPKFAQNRL